MPPEREREDLTLLKTLLQRYELRMYNCGTQWILRPKFIQWESFIRDGQSLECLVRGPNALGSRINALLPIADSVGSNGLQCGTGLPS